MRLFLSAGHYALARGAAWKGFIEHDEAALWVADIAKQVPCETVPSTALAGKIRWINDRATYEDLAVEVHFNAAPGNAGQGCEALFRIGDQASRFYAMQLNAALTPFFRPDRGVKARADLAFLNATICRSVILEPEFVYQGEHIRQKRAQACAALAFALRTFL